MDGDYDYDRYDRDSDYADGVDDAMDELGDYIARGIKNYEMVSWIVNAPANVVFVRGNRENAGAFVHRDDGL